MERINFAAVNRGINRGMFVGFSGNRGIGARKTI